jgi:immune inhibitor A
MTSLTCGSIPALGAVALAATTACASLAAQDIEELARQRGIPLPAAYYDRVRVDPTAYQFSRALFNRTGVRPTVEGAAAAPLRTASHGVVTLPVVLALFSDSPNPPQITRDMIDQSLFTGPAPRGTVTEAYLEMSRGALEVRGDVFDWVRSTLRMTDAVGASDGFGSDAQLGAYFTEALDAIDEGVDFALYDNDGPDGVANSGDDDGFVDVVTFEFLEVAASCGGPAIWPHRWTISGQRAAAGQPRAPYVTNDHSVTGEAILVEDYITQSVADCTGQEVQDASTIAHEFGHALGLPDYYHPTASGIGPEGRRWVMGCWALMAGGSWGCGTLGGQRGAFGPTHMMAQSKYQLGWVDYFDVGEVWNEEVVLDPVQTSGIALRLPMGDEGTEYLIAEYRAHYGFDAQLPADGVIMYKLDETASRRPDPATGDPYFLTLLEQDGDRGLLRNDLEGGDRGVPGDAWGVDGVTSPLNAQTIPQLRLRPHACHGP